MDRLIEILERVKPGVDFINHDSLIDTGVLDSLDIIAIITEIEKNYKIEISPAQIDPDNFQSVHTMQQMIQHIQSK